MPWRCLGALLLEQVLHQLIERAVIHAGAVDHPRPMGRDGAPRGPNPAALLPDVEPAGFTCARHAAGCVLDRLGAEKRDGAAHEAPPVVLVKLRCLPLNASAFGLSLPARGIDAAMRRSQLARVLFTTGPGVS